MTQKVYFNAHKRNFNPDPIWDQKCNNKECAV